MEQTICVCGAGTMGNGIAQVAAQAGYATILYDLSQPVLSKARENIDQSLSRLVEKSRISDVERDAIWNQLRFTSDINACKADIVIEAVVERVDVKIALFNQLADINQPSTIFASNTSSLSLNEIARHLNKPQRFIGMHFFNPAPIMKLVEVVVTDHTGEQVKDTIIELAKAMGKTPVVCRDSPGFIVNRVARPFYIEALRLVEEGYTDFPSIDGLIEATGFKMGPFKLMDLIGNDINYAVSCSVFEQMNRPARLRPSAIQEEKVKSGELGRKTGKGYYQYNKV